VTYVIYFIKGGNPMAKMTPEEFADAHLTGLRGAGDKIRRGVENVDESPGVKAARQIDKMRQGLMEAFDDGRVEAGLKGFSLEDWKQAMLTKGVNAIVTGAQNSRAKVVAFAEKFLPYLERAKAEVDNMPKVTIEDSIEKAGAWIRKMHDFRNM
jgi:hypothetical protein